MSGSTEKTIVGVDIGSHTCKIALFSGGKADVVQSNKMLSQVTFDVKGRRFGESAQSLEMNSSSSLDTVNCPLGIVGKSLQSLQHEETLEREGHFVRRPLVDVSAVAGVEVTAFGERCSVSSTQLVAMFLSRLRLLAAIISNSTALAFVISVPPSFDAVQKQAVRDAAFIAGMDLLGIVDETTAVILCHAVRRPDQPGIVEQISKIMSSVAETVYFLLGRVLAPTVPGPSEPDSSLIQAQGLDRTRYNRHVVFIDIGHSSSTASLVGYSHAQTAVLSIETDPGFGGRNIDDALAQHISARFTLDLAGDPRAAGRLLSACQGLKEALSDARKAVLSVDAGVRIHTTLGRGELEELAGPLFDRVQPLLRRVFSAANVAPLDIDAVEFVGGTTRIPAFRRRVREVVPHASLLTSLGSESSIAHGAALAYGLPRPDFDALGFSNCHGNVDTVDNNYNEGGCDREEYRRNEMKMFSAETENIGSILKNSIDDTPDALLASRSAMLQEEPILRGSCEPLGVWRDVGRFKLSASSQVQWLQVLCDLFFGRRLSEELAFRAQMTPESHELYGCLRRILQQGYFLPEENHALARRLQCYEEFFGKIKATRSLSTLDPILQLSERMTSALNLSGAPEIHEEMVDTTLLTLDVDRPGSALILGFVSLLGIEQGNNIEDVNRAIEAFHSLEEWTPMRDPNRPAYLSILGGSLMRRFIHLRQPEDIEECTTLLGQADKHTPTEDGKRVMRLNNLAHALLWRFNLRRQPGDIQESIRLLERVVQLTPAGDPVRAKYAKAIHHLIVLFAQSREVNHELGVYIPVIRLAVNLTPVGDPHLPTRRFLLGSQLWLRFLQLGDNMDLEEGIRLFQQTTNPLGVDDNSIPCFSILASMLQKRFTLLKNDEDITQAIQLYREIVRHKSGNSGRSADNTPQISLFAPPWANLAASGSFDQAHSLRTLGSALLFQMPAGRLEDNHDGLDGSIEEAIDCFQKACFESKDNKGRAQDISCLSVLHAVRFIRSGSVAIRDLDQAVQFSEDYLAIPSEDNTPQVIYLTLRGALLIMRFIYFGEILDRNEGIKLCQQARDLAETQPAYDLADSDKLVAGIMHLISTTFLRSPPRPHGGNEDQNLAFSYLQMCADLLQPDSPSRKGVPVETLRALAFQHVVQFRKTKDVSDISQSIQFFRKALENLSTDSPYRAGYFSSLARLIFDRFELTGSESDREAAIELLREAIPITSVNSHERLSLLRQFCYTILGHRILMKGKHDADLEDVKQALWEAYNFPKPHISSRISTLILFSQFCHIYAPQHTASLLAYGEAIELFPQIAWLGLSLSSRLEKIGSIQSVPCDAGACAIGLSQRTECSPDDEQELLGRAVQLIDQGRSINWEQAWKLNTDLEALRGRDSELADRLANIRTALNDSSFQDFDSSMLSNHDGERRRELAGQWEELITSVRKIDGFEDFLLAPPYEQLRNGVVGGYAVVMNASQHRCDAIIIPPVGCGPLHLVPLPDLSLKEIDKLVDDLQKGQQLIRLEVEDPVFDRRVLPKILNVLWEKAVEPVVNRLEEIGALKDHERCRVWWCPIGSLTFLPLHAAGYHKPRGRRDRRIEQITPSYISTLSSLLRVRQAKPSGQLCRLLAVNSNTPGQRELEFAGGEIEEIQRLLHPSMFKSLSGTDATVGRVLRELEDCNIAHFTCHGRQDADNPAQTALLLHDGSLHISKISQVRSRHGMLAMLLACESAMGSFKHPNEAMHISASFQFLGFHSVVATMWQIQDSDGLDVAKRFYEHLFGNAHEGKVDLSDAAYALNQAVLALRDSNVPLHRWTPFIHIGL